MNEFKFWLEDQEVSSFLSTVYGTYLDARLSLNEARASGQFGDEANNEMLNKSLGLIEDPANPDAPHVNHPFNWMPWLRRQISGKLGDSSASIEDTTNHVLASIERDLRPSTPSGEEEGWSRGRETPLKTRINNLHATISDPDELVDKIQKAILGILRYKVSDFLRSEIKRSPLDHLWDKVRDGNFEDFADPTGAKREYDEKYSQNPERIPPLAERRAYFEKYGHRNLPPSNVSIDAMGRGEAPNIRVARQSVSAGLDVMPLKKKFIDALQAKLHQATRGGEPNLADPNTQNIMLAIAILKDSMEEASEEELVNKYSGSGPGKIGFDFSGTVSRNRIRGAKKAMQDAVLQSMGATSREQAIEKVREAALAA